MSILTVGRVHHDTIRMERTYRASPERVFDAWRDVAARLRWSRPSPHVEIVYDKAEFRVGGEDVTRCGSAGDLRYVAKVRYLEIEDDSRIVFAEHVAEDGVSKAAALIDVTLAPAGRETRLILTMQIAAFDSADMLHGYRQGWTPALENLANELWDRETEHGT